MGPVQSVKICMRKYFKFSGRASRAEFWWFIGLYLSFSLSPIIWRLIHWTLADKSLPAITSGQENMFLFLVQSVVGLLLIIPVFAVSWRRLHDLGWHGWVFAIWFVFWLLASRTIPAAIMLLAAFSQYPEESPTLLMWVLAYGPFILSPILLLAFVVVMARPSQPNSNNYGPNPHEVTP